MVDDGSTDGTPEAVRSAFPDVEVIEHDGSLFWNRGMHVAFARALRNRYDFYLWLNDDTTLSEDALENLFGAYEDVLGRGQPAIIVGSTADPETGQLTYGGQAQRSRLRPLHLTAVEPTREPVPCDTMNGNVVLVPAVVAQTIGNLDWVFEHAMGDTDYGLRARLAGMRPWIAPGFVGTCKRNSSPSFSDPSVPLARRLRSAIDRKHLPWRSWAVLTRRHTGPLWPLHFAWPYLKIVLGSATQRVRAGSPLRGLR